MADQPLSFNVGGTGFGVLKHFRGFLTAAQKNQLHPAGPANAASTLTFALNTDVVAFTTGSELGAPGLDPVLDAQGVWTGLTNAHVTQFNDFAMSGQSATVAVRMDGLAADGAGTGLGMDQSGNAYDIGVSLYLRDDAAHQLWNGAATTPSLLIAVAGAPGFIVVNLVEIGTDVAVMGEPPVVTRSEDTAILIGPIEYGKLNSHIATINGFHTLGYGMTIPLLGTGSSPTAPNAAMMPVDIGFDFAGLQDKINLGLANRPSAICKIKVVSQSGGGLYLLYTRNVAADPDDHWAVTIANQEWAYKAGYYDDYHGLSGYKGDFVLVSGVSEQNASVGPDGESTVGGDLATIVTTFYGEAKMSMVSTPSPVAEWTPITVAPPVAVSPCKCETPWWLLIAGIIVGRITKSKDDNRQNVSSKE